MKLTPNERSALAEINRAGRGKVDWSLVHGRTLHALERKRLVEPANPGWKLTAAGTAELQPVDKLVANGPAFKAINEGKLGLRTPRVLSPGKRHPTHFSGGPDQPLTPSPAPPYMGHTGPRAGWGDPVNRYSAALIDALARLRKAGPLIVPDELDTPRDLIAYDLELQRAAIAFVAELTAVQHRSPGTGTTIATLQPVKVPL